MSTLLVANRGEVAVRVLRTAADLGLRTVAVHSTDDADALHVRLADVAVRLDGEGPAPYLDPDQLVKAALEHGCDLVHPGYGFLSENADFARACAEAGLVFVGPSPEVLALLGDKSRARALAASLDIPVLEGTGPVDLAAAREFFTGPVMVKAVAGGGGKGMREVHRAEDLPAAFERCRAEALAAFGDGEVYLERLLTRARHVEVQLVGTTVLGDRDCSLQSGHQKVVEIAPAPRLAAGVRAGLHDAAARIAEAVDYTGVGTVEFLVSPDGGFVFLEANPRLQVEHTVTEEVTGVDLVRAQLVLAAGGTPDLTRHDRGCAVQLRITLGSAGTVAVFQPATGPGVRVDTHAYGGYRAGDRFDALLAKLVVHADDLDTALRKARRALAEFRVDGVPTNLPFLHDLLERDLTDAHTGFLDELPAPPTGDGPRSPVHGTVVAVEPGAVVVEAMKMQHVVPVGDGRVLVAVGDTVTEGAPLAESGTADAVAEVEQADLDAIRPDLAEVLARHDFRRPDAEAKRHAAGRRTARENVADLCDPDGFVEYGGLAIAAQRQRRSVAELVERTPADGLVAGIGTVDGRRAVVMSYDYAVLAGTQGVRNHAKLDRMLALAEQRRLPVVLFAEGGGGRPGDTDHGMVSGLDTGSFHAMAKLSGLVPLVGVVSGRCFAGNAVLLGTCDVIIATADANIGMGGPAMVEGGGLGVFRPEEIGPMDVQVPNGVVDVAVADEAEAVAVARRYLSYFGGPKADWTAPDQRLLRHAVPENRLRAYDVRTVVETIADTGEVLELRRAFGRGIVTALVRVEGRPFGLIANDPAHLGGAIDADAADKAARFLRLCDAFDLPVLSLCDTPGFMVGPDAERTATVRHLTRMMVAAADLDVPFGLVVLRKAYGLGAQAMAGGSLAVPGFAVSWPSGEFGPMGLEGAVRLGFRRELEAIDDPAERQAAFDRMVAASYEHGKALNLAAAFEIDDVIDPADTRRWISSSLTADRGEQRRERRRKVVDTW
ncbi:carboxyl transferase domain-containing protein [Umezawaea tangerina]|uniref:Biotin carboxylase C-terminal domain-containing protein n=1 Tax=Umezawaea tangerina TaxID=84725 RepID=A0A2T0SBX3_9PSEU|nr:carboxyl transferase domain-containing protein [Umezawaea tangerina]PRY30925.1 biotin carboxylase C-terminal domain-containing protein [Umezawaea tangerina]